MPDADSCGLLYPQLIQFTKLAGLAGVAQLVEQRIRNAWVGGSIPLSGTNSLGRRASSAAIAFGAPWNRATMRSEVTW